MYLNTVFWKYIWNWPPSEVTLFSPVYTKNHNYKDNYWCILSIQRSYVICH